MAQQDSSKDISNIDDTVGLRDIPEGSKVRLRNGAIAEVTANPMDGGWIFIRFIEFPDEPDRVGEDDMAFCTDVLAVV
jgi:hypothetical protein